MSFQHAFDAVRGPVLQKLCAEASKPLQAKVGIFTPVQEFLQNAGQIHLVEQVSYTPGSVYINKSAQQHRLSMAV